MARNRLQKLGEKKKKRPGCMPPTFVAATSVGILSYRWHCGKVFIPWEKWAFWKSFFFRGACFSLQPQPSLQSELKKKVFCMRAMWPELGFTEFSWSSCSLRLTPGKLRVSGGLRLLISLYHFFECFKTYLSFKVIVQNSSYQYFLSIYRTLHKYTQRLYKYSIVFH